MPSSGQSWLRLCWDRPMSFGNRSSTSSCCCMNLPWASRCSQKRDSGWRMR